jgi:hypothetical protein
MFSTDLAEIVLITFHVPREKLEEAADHKGHAVYGPVYLDWMKPSRTTSTIPTGTCSSSGPQTREERIHEG